MAFQCSFSVWPAFCAAGTANRLLSLRVRQTNCQLFLGGRAADLSFKHLNLRASDRVGLEVRGRGLVFLHANLPETEERRKAYTEKQVHHQGDHRDINRKLEATQRNCKNR